MAERGEWLNDTTHDAHSIKRAALVHHRLVAIYPFIDGNDRTARLMMNLLLMRDSYPPTIIMKANRRQYYRILAQADHGNEDTPYSQEYLSLLARTG